LKILLDTHIFLWAINESERLSAQAAEAIRNPANEALVSIASAWEIAIKVSIGKFAMPSPLAPYLQGQLARHNLRVLPIEFSHLQVLEKLPLHHRDPFDRLLVAQAIDEDATLITVDAQLRRYKLKTIS
jgi:PIN domain nuclease of toxin-antitoxin system